MSSRCYDWIKEELGGTISATGISFTRADGRPESRQSKAVSVRTPSGLQELNADAFAEVVAYPAEVIYLSQSVRGAGDQVFKPGWYSHLELSPLDPSVFESEINALKVGQEIPSALAIQYLKYNPEHEGYKVSVQYGDVSVEYSALELIELLCHAQKDGFHAVRAENGIAFETRPTPGYYGRDGQPCFIQESATVAEKWPHDTATVNLSSGETVEVSRDELIVLAATPQDIQLDEQCKWVCNAEEGLWTKQRVLEHLATIESGGELDRWMATIVRKHIPGTDLDNVILNAGTPMQIVTVHHWLKRKPEGEPLSADDFQFSVRGNHRYSR